MLQTCHEFLDTVRRFNVIKQAVEAGFENDEVPVHCCCKKELMDYVGTIDRNQKAVDAVLQILRWTTNQALAELKNISTDIDV